MRATSVAICSVSALTCSFRSAIWDFTKFFTSVISAVISAGRGGGGGLVAAVVFDRFIGGVGGGAVSESKRMRRVVWSVQGSLGGLAGVWTWELPELFNCSAIVGYLGSRP
jgi:hypothetical protein